MQVGQAYTQGNWLVKEGLEKQFIDQWTEFVSWSAKNAEGAGDFILIQSVGDSRRFVSFGAWKDRASVDSWRSTPEFADLLGKCRALCDEFQPNDSTLVAAVPSG